MLTSMSTSRRFLTVIGFLGLGFAAQAQLNPTVKVLPKASSSVPTDCATGEMTPAPRLLLADDGDALDQADDTTAAMPLVTAKAPPSSRLRETLRRVQSAADRNDHDAFTSALAAAHATVDAYPRGGERDSAAATLRVYDDLARVWSYQYSNSAGSFFDEGELLTTLRAYPGYQQAMADKTLVTGGRTLYPTTESRAFLAREAARRLGGGRATASAPTPAYAPVTRAGGQHREPRLHKAPNAAPPPVMHTTAHATAPRPAAVKPVVRTVTKAPTPSPASQPKPATATVAPPPSPAAPPSATTAGSMATTATTDTAAAPTSTTATETSATAPAATDTTFTSASDTTATTAPTASADEPVIPPSAPVETSQTVKIVIGSALVLAAVAFLVYLFRSGD
jgi:hypothetical protein